MGDPDITLLHLSEPATLHKGAKTVCLASPGLQFWSFDGIITGWG